MRGSDIVRTLLSGWESAGEIAPGSGPLVLRGLGPVSGDPAEAIGGLVTAVYGRPGVAAVLEPTTGERYPGRPDAGPSPFLLKSAPSLKLHPATAAATRLAPLLRKGQPESIAREWVGATTAGGPGDVAGAMAGRLYGDRQNWHRLTTRPTLPAGERAGADALRALAEIGAVRDDLDPETEAGAFAGLTTADRVIGRLRTRPDLWPSGEPPKVSAYDLDTGLRARSAVRFAALRYEIDSEYGPAAPTDPDLAHAGRVAALVESTRGDGVYA